MISSFSPPKRKTRISLASTARIAAAAFLLAGVGAGWGAGSALNHAEARALLGAIRAGEGDRTSLIARAQTHLDRAITTADVLDTKAELALWRDPPDLDAAEALTRQALQRSPQRAESWARLAHIETLRTGQMTPEAVAHLHRSFEAAPIGIEALRRWRLTFIAHHWSEADPALREAALAQIKPIRSRRRGWAWLHALSLSVPEPARLAIQTRAQEP